MTKEITKTIVLVGLMGAGKTSIGERLAASLHLPFVDIDHAIEAEQGMSVTDIFAKQGEAAFRRMEHDCIAAYLRGEPHIMATGGGAFMQQDTRTLIKKEAVSVWLHAELDVLVERVSRKNTRPLLETGDKYSIMKKLMEERYPIYGEADIVIESTDAPHEEVVKRIIEAL